MSIDTFGTPENGRKILGARLKSTSGAEAHVIEWGAVVRDLVVPLSDGTPQRVVLGFDGLEAYQYHSRYAGATVGRFANRIAHGRFSLDGTTFQVPLNERGRHSLHGGT